MSCVDLVILRQPQTSLSRWYEAGGKTYAVVFNDLAFNFNERFQLQNTTGSLTINGLTVAADSAYPAYLLRWHPGLKGGHRTSSRDPDNSGQVAVLLDIDVSGILKQGQNIFGLVVAMFEP